MSETTREKNKDNKILFFSFKKIENSEGKTLSILATVRTEKSIKQNHSAVWWWL
jgi:hypothetical protein